VKFLKLFLVTTFLLTGCCGPQDKEKKNVRIAFLKDPPSIDTRKTADCLSSTFHFMLYAGLTKSNSQGDIENFLAETVEISDDRLEYIFTLKEACWSDGSPVVAYDFERSWKELLTPDFPSPVAQLFYPIKNAYKVKLGEIPPDEVGVEAISEKVLKVTLEQPTPHFLHLTAFCALFPMKADEKGEWLSNGPFRLKQWKHNDELILEANPHYFEKESVNLDEIRIMIVENESTAFKMYEQGNLDFISSCLCHLPLDLIESYIKKNQVQFKPLAANARLYFNTKKFPFNNVKIRRAIGLAINREEIVQALAPFPAQVATGIVPPILKRKGALAPKLEGDAQALLQEGLAELGLEALPAIDLIYAFSEISNKLVLVIQEQLRANLGITLNLEGVDFRIFLSRMKTHDYTIAQGKWIAQYNDPLSLLELFKYEKDLTNMPHWEDPRFQAYLDQAAFAQSKEERLLILEQAEQLLIDEQPLSPLFYWSDHYMPSARMKGFYVCPVKPPEYQEEVQNGIP